MISGGDGNDMWGQIAGKQFGNLLPGIAAIDNESVKAVEIAALRPGCR